MGRIIPYSNNHIWKIKNVLNHQPDGDFGLIPHQRTIKYGDMQDDGPLSFPRVGRSIIRASDIM